MSDEAPVKGGRMPRWLWLAAALLCFAAFAQQFVGIGFTKKISINPDAMEPDQGHAWRVRLPENHQSTAAHYTIRILEDGEHKGELATSNARVRDHGTGRYRLGNKGILRFSASDNSNPEFNGRKYVAEVPVSVNPAVLVATLVVFIGAGVLARSQRAFSFRRPPPAALLALAVFAVSLGVRLWALGAYADYSDGGFAVKGSPYSDALAWTDLALNLRDGYGFDGPFAGQRPLYPVFMAAIYRFFGDSLVVGKLVNVVCGALSVMFVFLLVSRATRQWSLGLAATVAILLTKQQLVGVQLLSTESIGLTLILAGAYAWWSGLVRLNLWTLLAAGLLIGLSNLTRTFTMLGLPLFAVITLAVCLLKRSGWRRGILLCAIFTAGATVTLAPWMVRQKLRYDTFALSSVGADLLYAAAKDPPGWTASLYEELNAAGIKKSQLKESNAFFSRRHKEEIAKDRGRYMKNVLAWIGAYLNHFDYHQPFARLAILAAGLAAGLVAWWHGKALVASGCLASCCVLTAMIGSVPPIAVVLSVSGLALWLGDRNSRLAVVVLLVTLASGALMSALVGNFSINRTTPLTAWVYLATIIIGLGAACRRLIASKGDQPPDDDVWQGIPAVFSWAIIGLIGIAIVVVASTGYSKVGVGANFQLSQKEQASVRDWIRKEIPATESAPDEVFATLLTELTHYRSSLRADEDTSHWARPFQPRPYERTTAYLRHFEGDHPRGTLRATQFRGELPAPRENTFYVLAGVLNVDPSAYLGHDVQMVEALALIPFSENPRAIRFEEALRFPVTPEAASIVKAKLPSEP